MPGIKMVIVTTLVLLLINPGQVHSQTKPVISFDVQPGKNRTVTIQWSTGLGIDSFDYKVEKSKDKKTWETIAHVAPQLSHNYSGIDFHPVEGINYYRIRQTGRKGQFSFTEIKWIQISKAGKLYIWPNPANDILHVKSPFVKGSMNIVDAGGKFIFKISITDFITDVPTTRLSKGIYFLHVNHDSEVLVEKFVKD